MLNWILMWDIIDSSNAVLLQQEFAKLIDQINQDFADDLLSPLTIIRSLENRNKNKN
ncbi:MAG: hypothetical protein ACQEW9_13330 [Bacteroidota bacterium]